MKKHVSVDNWVVWFIGTSLLLCIAGGLVITYKRDVDSSWVEKIALVLAGGLVGLLANARGTAPGTPAEPISANIVNIPADPVPVQAAGPTAPAKTGQGD